MKAGDKEYRDETLDGVTDWRRDGVSVNSAGVGDGQWKPAKAAIHGHKSRTRTGKLELN